MTTVSSHRRSGTWVEGHYRNGHWVEGHYRSDTIIGSHDRTVAGGYSPPTVSWRIRDYSTPLTYPTACWWCGNAVFFYRSDNGGCALFNELGWPWQPHGCWQRYRDDLLHRVSSELDDLHFDGRSYHQPREQIKKERGQSTFQGTGFIDKGQASHQDFPKIRSCRSATTVALIPVRFVPNDRPGHYLTVYVPCDRKDLFAPYSIHQIDASWIKRGNRSLCLVTSTRILQANTRPAGRPRSILTLTGNCYYCNTTLENVCAWGLDTDGNQECGECGHMRRGLSADVFRQRVRQIAQSLSSHK